jgi:Arc/MetJ family transcription regulator
MRITLTLDDELLERAKEVTGITKTTALVREALKALVEREAARRLARLGGSQPHLLHVPRRRSRVT